MTPPVVDAAAEAALAVLGWRADRHPQELELTAISFTPGLDATRLVRRPYLTSGDSDLV